MNKEKLISIASSLVRPITLSRPDMDAGTVGCALLSKEGKVYTGVCFHVSCGIGICAEHAAVAEMLKNGETQIDTIVATNGTGILSPCGRCRELIIQIDEQNWKTIVLLEGGNQKTVKELLPDHWLGGD